MSTVTVTYDYVYFQGGPDHTRQPRSTTGPGGFTLINQSSGGTAQTGDTFATGDQPATKTVNGVTYTFAFTNVSGGTPAGQTTPSGVDSFDSNIPPPSVTVGSAPIVVLVVYLPVGGNGGGGSGASIDSFDVFRYLRVGFAGLGWPAAADNQRQRNWLRGHNQRNRDHYGSFANLPDWRHS